jgi:D-glycero-D-manno-heptose 1,7-bisphosphate phosphatase
VKRWGVFLDRDGTLLPDVGYARDPGQLVLYRKTNAALRKLQKAGAVLIVVSNQSAVARGLLDLDGLARMDARLMSLMKRAGVHLSAIYNCPHHPDFDGPCDCRKPEPGMIRKGLKAFKLTPSACFLVGDHATDLEAGRRAGLRTVHVLTGHGRRHRNEIKEARLADGLAKDISGAVEWILETRALKPRTR